jgi:hypothetical protein
MIAGTVLSINQPVPDFGGLYITDTSEHFAVAPQAFTHFFCLTDAVIDISGGSIAGTVTAVPVKAGMILPWFGNRIKLASGSGIAYYGDSQ